MYLCENDILSRNDVQVTNGTSKKPDHTGTSVGGLYCLEQ